MHWYASLKLLPLIAEYNKWETLYIYELFNIFPFFFNWLIGKEKNIPSKLWQPELNRHYQNIYKNVLMYISAWNSNGNFHTVGSQGVSFTAWGHTETAL